MLIDKYTKVSIHYFTKKFIQPENQILIKVYVIYYMYFYFYLNNKKFMIIFSSFQMIFCKLKNYSIY